MRLSRWEERAETPGIAGLRRTLGNARNCGPGVAWTTRRRARRRGETVDGTVRLHAAAWGIVHGEPVRIARPASTEDSRRRSEIGAATGGSAPLPSTEPSMESV